MSSNRDEESKNAKEIQVLEVDWQNFIYADDDRVVKRYFQMACAFGANLMMTCYGLICPASGFLLPQLEDPIIGFGINKEEGSWLASIMVLGSLSGALAGGLQCGKFGRKRSMMFDCIIFFVGTLLSAFAPHFYVILAARLLLGHSAASSMVACPMYTSETSQPQVRKTTGSFTIVCYTTGFALALILGAVFPWRWAVGIVVIAPVSCFIILIFCPETPVWLLSKGREEEARRALERLRGVENQDIVQAEFNRISLNLKIQEKEKEINQEGSSSPSKIRELTHLLTDVTFMKPFGFLLVIFCVGFEWTGLPAIAFYMVPLLKDAEIPFDPYWAAAMLATFRALLNILSLSVAGRLKRRPVYLSCCMLTCAGTLSLASYCYFNQNGLLTESFPIARWIPIFSILIVYVAFSAGFGSIPYMLQGELLPAHARSIGSGLLGIMDNLSLFYSTKMVPTWNELFGIHGTFLMYSGICLLMCIFAAFFMPETSGMSLEEIEDMYRPKDKKKNIHH